MALTSIPPMWHQMIRDCPRENLSILMRHIEMCEMVNERERQYERVRKERLEALMSKGIKRSL